MDHDTIYKGAYVSDTANIQWIFMLGLTSSEHSLRDKNVQKFIHRNDLHFDLIISEQFFQESWLLFAYKHNAPILTICMYKYLFWSTDFWNYIFLFLTYLPP